jgi:carbonic anhydrase/acetyltransferase-like protein (isoleucine patch superfamily)
MSVSLGPERVDRWLLGPSSMPAILIASAPKVTRIVPGDEINSDPEMRKKGTAAALQDTLLMIEPSAYIAPGAIVVGRVELGRDSSVWYNAVLRGDTDRIAIGEGTNVQDLSMVHADPGIPCLVGNRVTVGHRVILHGCTIEDECLIGMGAILLNGVRVGKGSVIGAGAVLAEGLEVPEGSLVLGVPGRIIRAVDESMRRRIDHAWRHYIAEAQRHRAGNFPICPPTLS